MDELDIQALLDKFKEAQFQKGEQIILAHSGTVQGLLSVIFQTPVNVSLISQQEQDGFIIRQVELRAAGTVAAFAATHIQKDRNREDVLLAIAKGSLGLGQILVTLNLPNRRNLIAVGRNKSGFWRLYVIEGPEVNLRIFEHFPRVPFESVGWITPQQKEE